MNHTSNAANTAPVPGPDIRKAMGLFERYLSLWAAVAVLLGIAIGQLAPAVPAVLSRFSCAS